MNDTQKNIDITQPVLGREAITQKRAEIAAELTDLETKNKGLRLGALLASISAFTIAIMAYFLIDLHYFAVLIVVLICGVTGTAICVIFSDYRAEVHSAGFGRAIFEVGIGIALVVVIAVGSISAAEVIFSYTTLVLVTVAITLGAAVTGIAFTVNLDNLKIRRSFLQSQLKGFGDTEPETCLEIKNWISDEVIGGFHRRVISESRSFTVGEVEAMRKFWDERAERAKVVDRINEIEAACNEVYPKSLVTSSNKMLTS